MATGENYTIGDYWTGSRIVGNRTKFDSTDRANNGTKSVKTDNANIGDVYQFLKDTTIDLSETT